MARDRFNYFSFWALFCPFTPLTAQKTQNFKKMKKSPEDIIILHMCTKKLWSDDVQFLRYGVRWTDGRTDGKSDI